MIEALLPAAGKILCAVSGGIDSVYMLCRLADSGREVAAAHFNHGLRGAEADRDERFVGELCAGRGIPFYAGRGDCAAYARQNKLSIETAARELRYQFLQATAQKIGAACIATAHTADDNAETLLLHLARGAGAEGLCGIPPRRDNIIRPILDETRAEAERYLATHAIAHVEDSTNAADDYARNFLRHRVMPALRQLNPSFSQAAARATQHLRDDTAFLNDMTERFLRACADSGSVDASALAAAPAAIAGRAVRRLAGASLSAEHVAMVLRVAERGGCADLPGLRAERRGGRVFFGAEAAPALPDRVIFPGETVSLPEAGLTLRCALSMEKPPIHNPLTSFCFAYAQICGNITVGARREGDTLRPVGRGCTKQLRRLLAESGCPAPLRDAVPVVRDEKGVLLLYGCCADERSAAAAAEGTYLLFEFSQIQSEEH